MIQLHQYPGAMGLPSLSPFCLKVEFFLRAAGLPYEVRLERNPGRGPKGKMPFIVDDGKVVADSTFILHHLIRRYRLSEFEITDLAEGARAVAFKAMIEEGLYFCLLHSRWIDPEGYRIISREFRKLFPVFLGPLFLSIIRRNLKRQALGQGFGRHSQDEVYGIGRDYLRALAQELGDKEYFFSGRLTTFDATAYAFLRTILAGPGSSPLLEEVRGQKNLCDYVRRLQVRCFPLDLHLAGEFDAGKVFDPLTKRQDDRRNDGVFRSVQN